MEFATGFVGVLTCSVITGGTPVHEFSVGGSKGSLTIQEGKLVGYKFGTFGTRDGIVENIFEEKLLAAPFNDVWGIATMELGIALKNQLDDNSSNSLSSIAASFQDGYFTQKVMEAIVDSRFGASICFYLTSYF